MSLRALLLLLVGTAIVAFIGINWSAMTAPTDLNLLIMDIRAPLGLVLLGLMALLSAVFVGLIAYTQGTVLMETRRHAKELSVQRELADKAEASRFTELRAHLDREVSRLAEVIGNQTRETLSRVDRAEMGLRERPVDAEISRLVQAVEPTTASCTPAWTGWRSVCASACRRSCLARRPRLPCCRVPPRPPGPRRAAARARQAERFAASVRRQHADGHGRFPEAAVLMRRVTTEGRAVSAAPAPEFPSGSAPAASRCPAAAA